jgi:DNA primase
VPRYLNSPGTVLYRKSGTLFGLAEAGPAAVAGGVPVITEGPLDVIAVATAGGGRYAPVAPCGCALTGGQVAALADVCDLGARGVLVAFDADLAGRLAAVRAYHLLCPVAGRIGAVVLPPGTDPAQVLYEHGPAGLAQVLAAGRVPLDLVVNAELAEWKRSLRYAEGRVGALRAIAPVIAAMPPPDVARQVSRLAARLGLDHATVTQAVTGALLTGNSDDRRFDAEPPARPAWRVRGGEGCDTRGL